MGEIRTPNSEWADRGEKRGGAAKSSGGHNTGPLSKNRGPVVQSRVKTSRVVVPWSGGLHCRPAARLVTVARRFRCTLRLKAGSRCADLRSILSVLALCATMGTPLDLEAVGDDEQDAVQAVEQAFAADDGDEVPPSETHRSARP